MSSQEMQLSVLYGRTYSLDITIRRGIAFEQHNNTIVCTFQNVQQSGLIYSMMYMERVYITFLLHPIHICVLFAWIKYEQLRQHFERLKSIESAEYVDATLV